MPACASQFSRLAHFLLQQERSQIDRIGSLNFSGKDTIMRHILSLFGSCVATLLSISSAVHAQTPTEDIKAKVQRLAAPLVENRDSRLQSIATLDHQGTGG